MKVNTIAKTQRLLIVDDDTLFANRLSSMVQSLSYEIDTTYSIEDAFKYLSEHHYDLVLVDLFFNGKQRGLELIETATKESRSLNTAFIVLTSYGSIQTAIDAVHRGADDYLAKGASGMVNIDQLKMSISHALRQKEMERELRMSQAIFQTLHYLSVTREGTDFFHELCERVASMLSATRVIYALYNNSAHSLEAHAMYPAISQDNTFSLLLSWLNSSVVSHKKSIMLPLDSDDTPQFLQDMLPGKASGIIAAVPVGTNNSSARGAFFVSTDDPNNFPPNTLNLMEILAQRLDAETARQDHIRERELMYEQLAHVQRMDALGNLAGGIAHDFNNLLCVINNSVHLMHEETSDELLKTIEDAAENGADLVKRLMHTVKPHEDDNDSFDLNDATKNVIEFVHRTFASHITIRTHLEDHLHCISGNANQIENALLNICLNAREAMNNEGTLEIRTQNIPLNVLYDNPELRTIFTTDAVCIHIKDNGCGMDEDALQHIFDPFFTTKHKSHGSGLGLTQVYNTVRSAGGHIIVKSSPGAGTTFSLYFPVSEAPQPVIEKQPESLPSEATDDKEHCILIVDDDTSLRFTTRMILERNGYKVIDADDGDAACDIFQKKHNEIDLVLLDMIMQRMGGYETFHHLQEINPHVPVLIISGFSKSEEVDDMLEKGAKGYIVKPFKMKEFTQTIQDILTA